MVENNLQNISSILILRGSIRRPKVPDIVMKEFVGNRLLLTKFPNKKLIICEEPEFNLTEFIKSQISIGIKTSLSFKFSDDPVKLFDDDFITGDGWIGLIDKFSIGEYTYKNPECTYCGIGSSQVLKFGDKSFYEVIWDNVSRSINQINIYMEVVSYGI